MDSVDSGCTLGAGEGQSSSQPSASSSSEVIVWEIEVPKVEIHNTRAHTHTAVLETEPLSTSTHRTTSYKFGENAVCHLGLQRASACGNRVLHVTRDPRQQVEISWLEKLSYASVPPSGNCW